MIKYRSSYNDIPFIETPLYSSDGGKNVVITGEDGTVLFRFPSIILEKFNE